MRNLLLKVLLNLLLMFSIFGLLTNDTEATNRTQIFTLGPNDPANLLVYNTNDINLRATADAIYDQAGTPLNTNLYLWTNSIKGIKDLVGTGGIITNFAEIWVGTTRVSTITVGTGSVDAASVARWDLAYSAPSFSTNQMWMSPNGNETNSGLSPWLPIASLTNAMTKLSSKTGRWVLNLSPAVYAESAQATLNNANIDLLINGNNSKIVTPANSLYVQGGATCRIVNATFDSGSYGVVANGANTRLFLHSGSALGTSASVGGVSSAIIYAGYDFVYTNTFLASGATIVPMPSMDETLSLGSTVGAFPVSAGSGSGFTWTSTITDAQHGQRGGTNLHALADGSGAGFLSAVDYTKLQNVVTNLGSGYGLGQLYNSDGTNTAGNAYAEKDWVRNLLAGDGLILYNITNLNSINTNYYIASATTGLTSQVRTYVGVTNGQYLGSGIMSTTRYTQVESPCTINAYLGFNTGGGRSLTLKPELYYSYDGTNELGDYDAGGQVITSTQGLYTFSIPFPTIVSTNSAGFYIIRKFKVVSAVNTPTAYVWGNGGATPSKIGFHSSTIDSSLGVRGATNVITGTSSSYDTVNRVATLGSFTNIASIGMTNGLSFRPSVINGTNSLMFTQNGTNWHLRLN